MANLIGTLSALLITALTIHLGGGYTVTPPQTSSDPSPPISAQMASAKPRPVQQPLSWNNLLKRILGRKPPVSIGPGGSRGDICLVTPGLGGKEIYHERPLFFWQGELSGVEVELDHSEDKVWSQALSLADRSIIYAGETLQPGQLYNWIVFDQLNVSVHKIPFKVIGGPKRDRITAELTTLETELKAKGATAEAIALQRATYFAARQLWADALQEAFSVEHLSNSLADAIKDISANSCGSITTKASSH